ncbi:MAG: hypothetical protein WC648_04755 [Candidatus Paceibacterota bacterium]
MKLNVYVRPNDINNLEDLLHTIPICNKHKHMKNIQKKSEKDLMSLRFDCKECKKIFSKQEASLKRIWKQLCKEQDKLENKTKI